MRVIESVCQRESACVRGHAWQACRCAHARCIDLRLTSACGTRWRRAQSQRDISSCQRSLRWRPGRCRPCRSSSRAAMPLPAFTLIANKADPPPPLPRRFRAALLMKALVYPPPPPILPPPSPPPSPPSVAGHALEYSTQPRLRQGTKAKAKRRQHPPILRDR